MVDGGPGHVPADLTYVHAWQVWQSLLDLVCSVLSWKDLHMCSLSLRSQVALAIMANVMHVLCYSRLA